MNLEMKVVCSNAWLDRQWYMPLCAKAPPRPPATKAQYLEHLLEARLNWHSKMIS
jgi:hypothetical protein